MSRVGKSPVAISGRRHHPGQRRQAVGQGQARRPASDPQRPGERQARRRQGRRPAGQRVEAGAHDVGHDPQSGPQHGGRRLQGLHARILEINGVGYRAAVQGKIAAAAARLQPRRQLPDSGRHHDQVREADRRSRSPAPTSSGSVRSPPRSAAIARPSPTRARASSTRPRRSAARKARRSKGHVEQTKELFARRAAARAATAPARRIGRPRLSVFRSSKHIYAQVIDDAQRRDRWRRPRRWTRRSKRQAQDRRRHRGAPRPSAS